MSAAGKWNVTMDTPIGRQTFVWELRASGGGWIGTMDSPSGRSDLNNLSVQGDDVGFQTRVGSPVGALDLTFSGTVSGEEISGTCRTTFGSFPFSGRRA